MTRPDIVGISPFFIVQDAAGALSFYRDRLGFEVTFQGFGDDLFFGIVRRGGAMIMFKDVGVDPLPNYRREPAARWDAYLLVPDPDALAAEFASRNVEFSDHSKTLMTVCAASSSRTRTVTSCSLVALGRRYVRTSCAPMDVS